MKNMKTKKTKKPPRIIVTVSGGVVQTVTFPRGLGAIEVEVRDYDIEGEEEVDLPKDTDGDAYESRVETNRKR